MIHLLILAVHLLATIAKLVRPGGVRAVVAESLVLKHQLLISSRARRRAPNLNSSIAPLQLIRADASDRTRLHLPAPSGDFMPWRFSHAGRRSAWMGPSFRRPKTCTHPDMPTNSIIDSSARSG